MFSKGSILLLARFYEINDYVYGEIFGLTSPVSFVIE